MVGSISSVRLFQACLASKTLEHGAIGRGPRGAMELLELMYTTSARLHRGAYEHGLLQRARLPVPTISVGNVTWGGTGKTPMTEYIARQALARGVAPVVLLRDYGGDEVPQHRARLAGTAALVAPGADRAAAAAAALAELRVRVPRPRAAAVLDDGLQHWRLERDLDLLMLSCLDPFGGGRLIPRGTLREPAPSGVARAHVVALHHSDLVPQPEVERIAAQVAEWNPRAVVIRTRFETEGLRHLAGPPLPPLPAPGPGPGRGGEGTLGGLPAFAFAGVGCPASFLATARGAGAALVGSALYRDHRPFAPRELAALAARAAAAGAAVLVTTEKDGHRCAGALRGLEGEGALPVPVAALAGRLAVSEGEAALHDALQRTLAPAHADY
eukprot:tig00000792_g4151.t1